MVRRMSGALRPSRLTRRQMQAKRAGAGPQEGRRLARGRARGVGRSYSYYTPSREGSTLQERTSCPLAGGPLGCRSTPRWRRIVPPFGRSHSTSTSSGAMGSSHATQIPPVPAHPSRDRTTQATAFQGVTLVSTRPCARSHVSLVGFSITAHRRALASGDIGRGSWRGRRGCARACRLPWPPPCPRAAKDGV
jgi:hypothetical protein